MNHLDRRVFRSTNGTRLFTMLVLASLLFSALTVLSPSGIRAQDSEVTTPTAEMQESQIDTTSEVPETSEQPPTEVPPVESPVEATEPPSGGMASYIADARGCPPGFDLSAADASTALATCVEPLAGVAFSLGTQNPGYPGDTRTTGGDGYVAWSDIPIGTAYSVVESVPQGSGDPWVSCALTGGPGGDQFRFFAAPGGFMEIGSSDPSLASYAQTSCHWLTTPIGEAETSPETSLASGTGEVHLTNYLCPVNYNTATMTLPALGAACATPGEGLTFTLEATNGASRTDVSNAQGQLSWTDVPAGELTIDEAIPDGYQYASPFCTIAPGSNGPGSTDLAFVQGDGKTITGQLAAGQLLECTLFHIAVPESTVALFPYLCASDNVGAELTLYALQRVCTTPGTDLAYAITAADGQQLNGTTGSNGFLEWKHLPSGPVRIGASVPPGFLLAAVFCDSAPPQGELDGVPYQMTIVENDVISYTIPERYSLNCFLYHIWNMPPPAPAGADSYVVNLTSYLCPPDATFDYIDDVANDSSQCHGAPGWSYEHVGEGISQTLTTDPVGATRASGSPAAPFTLTQATPEGAIPVALWCSSNGGNYRNMLDHYQSDFAYTPTAGEVLNCQWFNVSLYPEGTSVRISIAKHRCGPDFPKTVVIEEWRAACPDPEPGVTFTVEQYDGSFASGTTGDDGVVTLQVQPGDVVIQAAPPVSLDDGYAWCGTRTNGGDPTYVNAGRLDAGESIVPLSNTNPAYEYVCEWFTVPTEPAHHTADDGGSVAVLEWRCPADFDAASATPDELYATCSTPQPGITIGVSYPSGDSFTQPTRLEKGPAIARFQNLPPGKVGIGEPGPSGHELKRVFCRTSDTGQAGLSVLDGYAEYTVADGGIAASIETGKEIDCHFFNVPTTSEDTPPMAGTVYVDKRLCPPGFAAIDSSYVDIAMYCASEPSVEFKITQGETVLSAVTGENGIARFSKIPAGELRISELPREGNDPPRVFCRATAEGAGATGNLDPVPVDNWGIAYDLRPGYYLECVWANMPAASTSADPGTVVLHLYACPDGTEEYASLQELLARCTDRPQGVTFTVGKPLSTPAEGATSAGGDVTFTDVAPGFNTIEEAARPGFRPIASWCDYYANATGSARDFRRHSVQPQYAYMSGGYTLECAWFDVAYVEPVTVTLLKRVCPADYGFEGASREDILFNCTESPSGVGFRVQSDVTTDPGGVAYDLTQATDASGSATFSHVPATPLTISEHASNYRAVRVYCGQVEAGPGQVPAAFTEMEIVGETVRHDAQPATNVLCYWVNVASTTATVTIHAYGCPEGYDPNDRDYAAVLGGCTAPLAGVTFTLGAPATELSRETDASGTVSWEAMAPGPLFINETLPAGYSDAVAWCAIHPASEFEPVPVKQLAIERAIAAGDALECVWFNYSDANHPSPAPIGTPVSKPGTPGPDSPASLILTRHTCAAGYDLHEPGANPAEDCETAGSGIELNLAPLGSERPAPETAITDSDGVAVFSTLDPGSWLLSATLPENTRTTFIASCQSDQRDFQLENPFTPFAYAGPEGQIGVVLIPGETLICDSFDVLQSTVTMLALQCPGLQFDATACAPTSEAVAIHLASVEGGQPITLATGASGVSFAEMPSGLYEITDRPAIVCLIDSAALDDDGHLVVQQDTPIEVRVYTCAGD